MLWVERRRHSCTDICYQNTGITSMPPILRPFNSIVLNHATFSRCICCVTDGTVCHLITPRWVHGIEVMDKSLHCLMRVLACLGVCFVKIIFMAGTQWLTHRRQCQHNEASCRDQLSIEDTCCDTHSFISACCVWLVMNWCKSLYPTLNA